MAADVSSAALERRVGHGAVLRAKFRGLYAAQLLSLIADRAAAIALAVLVYERSSSRLLADLSRVSSGGRAGHDRE